jgi:hypothetical protein
MFYSVQQVVCNFLSLTNGSSWFKVIKVIAPSTRASKHMVNKNMADNKGRKSGEYFGQRSKWKIFCTIMKMKWSCGIYQTVIIPRRMPGKGRWKELK